jgi:hypothetical protein
MWSNSYGIENRYQNSPRANGANRVNNPHFDKDGKPASKEAKAINEKINKVSNTSQMLAKTEDRATYKL